MYGAVLRRSRICGVLNEPERTARRGPRVRSPSETFGTSVSCSALSVSSGPEWQPMHPPLPWKRSSPAPGRRRQRALVERADRRLEGVQVGDERGDLLGGLRRGLLVAALEVRLDRPDGEAAQARPLARPAVRRGVRAPHSEGTSRGPVKSPSFCGCTMVPRSGFVPPPPMWQPPHHCPPWPRGRVEEPRRPSAARAACGRTPSRLGGAQHAPELRRVHRPHAGVGIVARPRSRRRRARR